jgi:hypothetical protein
MMARGPASVGPASASVVQLGKGLNARQWDKEASRTPSWHDAWTWCRKTRPDLLDAVDDALDAIDAAFQAEYAADSIHACRLLELAIRAGAEAYLEARRETGGGGDTLGGTGGATSAQSPSKAMNACLGIR